VIASSLKTRLTVAVSLFNLYFVLHVFVSSTSSPLDFSIYVLVARVIMYILPGMGGGGGLFAPFLGIGVPSGV